MSPVPTSPVPTSPAQTLAAKSLPTLSEIEAAARILAPALVRTPAIAALGLQAALGVDIVLKLETLQRTGSFKERGALNKLANLTAEERARGVIAMSAGNHAQGVAFHAQRLGIPATIVMPQGTPFTKVERTAGFGARVLLRGASLSEARQAANRLAEEESLVFVHPYDDAQIIAGQGTLALELLADHPELDTILVPIGGGGMIAGVAIAAKALKPGIEIIGVQSEQYPSMHHALAGLPLPPPAHTIAEGIGVKEPGILTEAAVRVHVDDIVLVSESHLEWAIELLLTQQKLVAEGAGAAGVAALVADPKRFHGKKVATVLCGGNIDARILASILMRGMARMGRLVRLRAEIPDLPGSLAAVAAVIGESGGNIVEIFHQRLFHDVPVKLAELDIVVESRDLAHVETIMANMVAAGFKARLLSSSTQAA